MRALLKEGAEDGDGNEGDATSGQESGADSGDESPSKKARIEMLRDMEKRRKEAARKLSGKSSSEDGEVNKGCTIRVCNHPPKRILDGHGNGNQAL